MKIENKGAVVLSGWVAKPAEFTDGEKPRTKVAVVVGKKDGQSVFENIIFWGKLALAASALKKGHQVLVAGHKRSNEYNGKTYEQVVGDFLSIMPYESNHDTYADRRPPAPEPPPLESINDDDLPF